jgi:hypothetical protein
MNNKQKTNLISCNLVAGTSSHLLQLTKQLKLGSFAMMSLLVRSYAATVNHWSQPSTMLLAYLTRYLLSLGEDSHSLLIWLRTHTDQWMLEPTWLIPVYLGRSSSYLHHRFLYFWRRPLSLHHRSAGQSCSKWRRTCRRFNTCRTLWIILFSTSPAIVWISISRLPSHYSDLNA